MAEEVKDTEETEEVTEKGNEVTEEEQQPEKKYTDEDVNAIIDKKFTKWQKEKDDAVKAKEEAIEEAKKLDKMNAEEKQEHEKEKDDTMKAKEETIEEAKKHEKKSAEEKQAHE